MRACSQRPTRGFTLIEVLVALSILAVLALMSWRGLDGMLRTQEATQQHQTDTMSLQIGLAQWTLDLEHLADNPDLYPLAWDGQTLRLLRRTGPAQPEGLLVVVWRIERDAPDQPGRWTRRQSGPLTERQALLQTWRDAGRPAGSAPSADNALGASGSQADLVPLSNWQVLFYRAGAWATASPPPTSSTPPRPARPLGEWPEGIRLQLQLPAGRVLSGQLQSDWFNPTGAPLTSSPANPPGTPGPGTPGNPADPANPAAALAPALPVTPVPPAPPVTPALGNPPS